MAWSNIYGAGVFGMGDTILQRTGGSLLRQHALLGGRSLESS